MSFPSQLVTFLGTNEVCCRSRFGSHDRKLIKTFYKIDRNISNEARATFVTLSESRIHRWSQQNGSHGIVGSRPPQQGC